MTLQLVFLALLAVHVGYSLTTNADACALKDKRKRRIHVLTQGPVLWLAIYFGAIQGVFSRELVSPLHIAAGLVIGHVIFALSLLITHRSLEDVGSHVFEFGAIWDFAMRSPAVLSRFLGGAVAEELIYRAAAQPIAIGLFALALGEGAAAAAGIAAVAAAFVVIHRDFFRNTAWQGVEFVAFAILLGVLYYGTGSFILVTVIHAIRNIEIAYLEYLAKVEELGDEERAAEETEKACRRIPSEQT
ncbi:MAG: CPBP family intramembrane metalloprotease [Candidatus Hydrogenedentes bacterium]|nr:CPBP family intramembrane metalloprotease [Candidatus Hydrogenedentota bacterium]